VANPLRRGDNRVNDRVVIHASRKAVALPPCLEAKPGRASLKERPREGNAFRYGSAKAR
jgi:hypothetical protein